MLRPQIVLFGDSITQHGFSDGGWCARLANDYSRKVRNRSVTRWAVAESRALSGACLGPKENDICVRAPAGCRHHGPAHQSPCA